MIPIQLTIKGLYSYTKAETIDFQPLVDAKLFGIFGPVGSGKSAILEAIMFVLFDRSSRLNKAGDDRYYNMMNLQSNEMMIDFIFISGRNHTKKYRFYFLAKRKAKDFQKVEVRDRSYYHWSKNEWQPLAKPDVLGMTYENFRQTVIIPQGKFSEFIDQKPAARTQMLKELFNLDRFDLAPQAFRLLGAIKERCNYLEGQLSQFENISKILLKQLSKEVELLKVNIDKQVIKEKNLSDQIGQMQVLRHIHDELVDVSDVLSTLESESSFIQQKQHQLNQYVKVRELFYEKIFQQQQLLHSVKAKQQELTKLIRVVANLEEASIKCKKNWEFAQQKYSEKEHFISQLADLKLVVQLKKVQKNFDEVSDKLNDSEKAMLQLAKEVRNIEKDSQRLGKVTEKKSKALEELQRLTQLKDWWNVSIGKKEQLELLKKRLKGVETDIGKLNETLRKLQKNANDTGSIKSKISVAKEDLQSLLIQEDWVEHANHLKEGEPCPLCGATSHPSPLPEAELSAAISGTRKNLISLENELELQQNLIRQTENLQIKISEKKQVLMDLEVQLNTLLGDMDLHNEEFPESQKTKTKPASLDKKIENVKYTIADIEATQITLNDTLGQADEAMSQYEIKKKSFNDLALAKEKLNGEISQMTRMIKTLDIKAFFKKGEPQIVELIERIQQKLETIENNYQQGLDNLSKTNQQLNHQKGLLQSLEVQVVDIEATSRKSEKELLTLCRKESFKGLVEVQKIIALNLDVKLERKELEKYHSELHAHRERKKALLKKLGNRKYQLSSHRQLELEWDSTKIELQQLRDQLSSKQHTHQQMEFQLQKKDAVVKELDQAAIRKGHIQEISNLLRGNGFINFISSVYLQNLCKIANVRFTKLTGNRLSLELNEQNEFMVRDYLNDGKLRLLKTLSGGQIFQASLCLALGLAENVKTLNQAEQSFFFLDEGFGSLDSGSLHLVFETLKSLQKENRIVGIISHVEALQAEIDTYLSVQQVEDKGSTITRSWEIVS